MYVPEDFENYKYVVSYHDNYVILTNRHSVIADYTNPQSIDVLYQYFIPSIYSFTGVYNISSSRTFEQVDVGSSFYDRADAPQLMSCILLLIFFLIFILNGLYKFVKRGGIFFGS